MSYKFPTNRIASGEPADPRLFDANSQPVAQEVSGRLNEHNFKAGEFSRTQVAQKAYFDFYHAEQASDPQFSTNGGACVSTDPNCFVVPDAGEWTVVDGMVLTVPSGEDLLWVIGWAQYGVVDKAGSPNYDVVSGTTGNKARLQFAIRVDGSVVSSTITGTQDLSWSAPRPILPVSPITDNASIHTFRTPGCQSMMYPVHPVRFQCHAPVRESSGHAVEMVVRRIQQDGVVVNENADPVVVFNRKLLCVKIVQNAAATGTADDVSVDPHVDGQLMNAATIYTQDQATLATALNSVSDGAVIRHGLRKEHLPSLILYPNQVGLSTGNITAQPYPGFGTNRNPTGGAGNWVYVDNGAGTNLRNTNGPYDFTATPAAVLILANVFVGELDSQAGLSDLFGCFGIGGRYTSGVYFARPSSEGYVNSPNVTAWGNPPVNTDVPLMEFYDYRTSPPAGGAVDWWHVAASRFDADVRWMRSNMMMIIFSRGA